MVAPVLLDPANFTPPTRTPWGGSRLAKSKGLPLKIRIGEAWEFSLGPEFSSRTESGETLRACIDKDRATWLGTQDGKCELLVKIVDAEENLSVQIHPEHKDPALAKDESGKPEAWYILEAAPGAGIYLGLHETATSEKMRAALSRNEDVSALLNFVPVAPGDFFSVLPGTAHAIGAGCVLLEPQGVMVGKKGITYRYWDWNRRYDSTGNVDPNGSARELHVERALACTNWNAARGADFVQQCRSYPNDAGIVESPCGLWAQIFRDSTRAVPAANHGRLCSFTALEEAAKIYWNEGELVVPRYSSAAIPASLPISIRAQHGVLCAIL